MMMTMMMGLQLQLGYEFFPLHPGRDGVDYEQLEERSVPMLFDSTLMEQRREQTGRKARNRKGREIKEGDDEQLEERSVLMLFE